VLLSSHIVNVDDNCAEVSDFCIFSLKCG